jgi:hypothetical protein
MPAPTVRSKVFISDDANPSIDWTDDASALADFEALDFTQVKFISQIGELGEQEEEIVGRSIDAGVLRYVGDRGPGSLEITCFRDALDEGQAAMVAASKTTAKYAVKIELVDTPAGADPKPSFFYMIAAIGSPRTNLGGASDIPTRVFVVQPSKAADILEVLAATGDA